MGIFKVGKGTLNAEENNQGSEEFNKDIIELMGRDDIHSRAEIFEAEFEKAQKMMNNPTTENKHRAYDLMGNLATQFDYLPAILWMGDFVEQELGNIEQAAYWYKMAADLGDKNAARRYAQMLMAGKGIQHDQQMAMYYYELAEEQQTQENPISIREKEPKFSNNEGINTESNRLLEKSLIQARALEQDSFTNRSFQGKVEAKEEAKSDDNRFPMKWHYFFIAILDLYAVLLIVFAFKVLAELGYFGEDFATFVYSKYPLLKQCDTYRGCSNLLIGVYTFIVALHLVKYQKGILGSLAILHLVTFIANIIYFIWGSSIIGISLFNYSNIIFLVLVIISLITNCVYYTKRIELFDN